MTLAQTYIAPWYARAQVLFGPLPDPIYAADYEGGANAEAKLVNGRPWFAWRTGYPSPALPPDVLEREAKRTACHEIGHPFEKLVPDSQSKFASWRGFDWAQWQADGREPREFFADAFGAALLGEWITPLGSSGPDRYRYELPTVTAQEARDFFLSLVGRAMYVELPSLFFGLRRAAIRYIVLHTTEGTDSREWLTRTGGVSAHYLVRGSTIYRLVQEDWTAWHAGQIVGTPTTPLYSGGNPNEESIGIEMEGFAANRLDDETLNATARLIKDIRSRRGPLPLVSHSELSPGNRTDPGPANRAAINALLEEDVAFKDDPDAIAYREDVKNTFEAIKTVLTDLSTRLDSVNAANDHRHETGGPISR